MTQISSQQNTQIMQIRALHLRKERERTGLFFVDGARQVLEALELGARVEAIVAVPALQKSRAVREALAQAYGRNVQCRYVTQEVFDSIASKETGQGIGAVVRQKWQPLQQSVPVAGRPWIALEQVQYPGNLGTILRTSDAVGGAGALLIGNTTDPYDPAAVRASTGAIFSQALVRAGLADLRAWKERHRLTFIGTSPAASVDYRLATYPHRLVVLMGSERYGMTEEMQGLCDLTVRIPMIGRSDSLNLAVSTALVLYEIFRQHELAQGISSPIRRE